MADPVLSTLQNIQIKVRRLTKSPSENILSTSDLNNYINTFVLYDFPEQLRLFNLHQTFTFFTQPFVSDYRTDATNVDDPLYNFQNLYLTINPPIYIAGFQALFLEDRSKFFGIYPKLNNIASIGTTGDGMTTSFSGYINTSQTVMQPFVQNSTQGVVLLENNVLFSSIDSNNNGLGLIDYPFDNTIGYLGLPGVPAASMVPYGKINYLTGAFTVNFPVAPGVGQQINSQVVPLSPSLPQAMLFYDGIFTLRPIPDQVYRVQMEVYTRPTALLNAGQSPKLEEWWQYIAYGAAKKVLEDRMDLESVANILPEFKAQEALILRRTIVQQTSQRVSSIYDNNANNAGAYGPGWINSGGLF